MKSHWLKSIIIFIGFMVLLGGVIVAIMAYRFYTQPMNLTTPGPTIVRLDKSMSATSFAHELKRQPPYFF